MTNDDAIDGWRAGERFAPWAMTVTADLQARLLTACEVRPDALAGQVDASMFAQACFLAILRTGRGIDGWVHVGQRIRMRDTVALGEPLVCSFSVQAIEPARRGRLMHLHFAYVRNGHAAPVALADLTALLPDPALMGAGGGGDAADLDGWRRLASKTLTPERVPAYSADVGNLIHFDPDFAVRYGYRAPLAQGLMGVTWVTGWLAGTAGPPGRLDLEARFRRPIHWDETIDLWTRSDGPASAPVRRFLCVNEADRAATEVSVADWG